jgi:hypothetical protein
LSLTPRQRTSAAVSEELFDQALRAMRRDRAFRSGPVLFACERAFEDILERIATINRRFSSALLIGASDPNWPARLSEIAGRVTALDPGAEFARAAGGAQVREDSIALEPASFDLAVAIGTLDTVGDLPGALLRLRFLLEPDGLLIGAVPGGETLPRLRDAMRAADLEMGEASPHVHPRIEPAAFAHLLSSAGFSMPVVDVDRISVAYPSLRRLVADLRGMGATNVLAKRSPRPLTRAALAAAERAFSGDADGRATERFELLHFAAWAPSGSAGQNG